MHTKLVSVLQENSADAGTIVISVRASFCTVQRSITQSEGFDGQIKRPPFLDVEMQAGLIITDLRTCKPY